MRCELRLIVISSPQLGKRPSARGGVCWRVAAAPLRCVACSDRCCAGRRFIWYVHAAFDGAGSVTPHGNGRTRARRERKKNDGQMGYFLTRCVLCTRRTKLATRQSQVCTYVVTSERVASCTVYARTYVVAQSISTDHRRRIRSHDRAAQAYTSN